MLQQRLTRNLYTGQTEPLTAPLSFDFTEDLGDKRNLSLLSQYGGAAAAYSLRALGSYNANVVRVRRASDNDEKDFTASQVSSGEMVNWVNSQTVPPLDIGKETEDGRTPVPEGGESIGTPAAAYSLRNLSTTYTGNVVDVRRSSDDAVASFTAAEVTDGTLLNFCRNINNADIISFADAGSTGSPAANKRMYFDGEDDFINHAAVSFPNTNDWSIDFSMIFTDTVGEGVGFKSGNQESFARFVSASELALRTKGYVFRTLSISPALQVGNTYNLSIKNVSGLIGLYSDGVLISSTAPVGLGFSNIATFGWMGSDFANQSEYIVWDVGYDTDGDGEYESFYQGYGNTNADWTDQIGSNDGTVNGSPALFTGQGFYDFDGFVSKWYDQSGNDNHATQGTAASQPKIVDGGALVSGGIDFDGVDDSLSTSDLSLFTLNNASSFVVSTVTTGGGQVASITEIGNGSNRFGNPYRYGNTYGFRYGDESAQLQPESINSTEAITSLIAGSSGAEGYKNGTSIKTYGTPNTTAIVNPISIGKSFAGTPSCLVQEAIFYPSDQSDNRTAIEANIGETYGITGIPAYDNTVDGFVETWYDQSGNGIDQTQSVASNQPQIVNNGALMTDAIYFGDGTFALIGGDTDVSVSSGVTVHCVLNGPQVADITGGIGGALWSLTDNTQIANNRVLLFRGVSSDNLQVFLENTAGTQTRVLAYNNFFQTYNGVDTLITTVFDVTANGISVYINGSLATPDSISGTYDNDVTADYFSIGSYGNASNVGRLDQNGVREILLDPSVDGTRRDGIMANIKSQYNIA